MLAQFNFPIPPELDDLIESNWRGASLRVLGQLGFGPHPRFRILFPSKLAPDHMPLLNGFPSLTFASREMLRIEAGLPSDPEFAAETTPFELGLEWLVSTTKGCYTGQEVLARQVTYDKVVRRLVPLQAPESMPPSVNLLADGKAIGQVTSTVISPRLGPIALAVVRKPYDAVGTELTLQTGEKIIRVTIR